MVNILPLFPSINSTLSPILKIQLKLKLNLNYCDTAYSRNGINQMRILKYSKDLVENLSSQSLTNNIH